MSRSITNSTEQLKALNLLMLVGYLEGTSFLLLLGIAMPLKYMMGIPEGVRYIGMAHGILFIAYVVILMNTSNKVKLPVWTMPLGVLGSLLPFGPFVFHVMLKNSVIKIKHNNNAPVIGTRKGN